jgi:hypothetical protein
MPRITHMDAPRRFFNIPHGFFDVSMRAKGLLRAYRLLQSGVGHTADAGLWRFRTADSARIEPISSF